METRTLRDMVRHYLTVNSDRFDGLVSDRDCACETGDLMPCDEPMPHGCQAGYKVEYPDGDCAGEHGDECPLEGECEWHIFPGPRPTP